MQVCSALQGHCTAPLSMMLLLDRLSSSSLSSIRQKRLICPRYDNSLRREKVSVYYYYCLKMQISWVLSAVLLHVYSFLDVLFITISSCSTVPIFVCYIVLLSSPMSTFFVRPMLTTLNLSLFVLIFYLNSNSYTVFITLAVCSNHLASDFDLLWIIWAISSAYLYPEWPHRQGGCLACYGCTFDSRGVCNDLYYARGAKGVLPMRVGGATSQLDLPSLTPLSVAGCGWLQLGVPHWAASVHYCK